VRGLAGIKRLVGSCRCWQLMVCGWIYEEFRTSACLDGFATHVEAVSPPCDVMWGRLYGISSAVARVPDSQAASPGCKVHRRSSFGDTHRSARVVTHFPVILGGSWGLVCVYSTNPCLWDSAAFATYRTPMRRIMAQRVNLCSRCLSRSHSRCLMAARLS
jgi:hypothetical protein